MSKADSLIKYLDDDRSRVITSWEVHEKFRTTTPSKVISDARVKCQSKGLELKDWWVDKVNEAGDHIRFKGYRVCERSVN